MDPKPISDDEARRMILQAKWVSPRDWEGLAMEMPCGRRFLLEWPETGEAMLWEQ